MRRTTMRTWTMEAFLFRDYLIERLDCEIV